MRKKTLFVLSILYVLVFSFSLQVRAQNNPVRKTPPSGMNVPVSKAIGSFISVNNAGYTQSADNISQLVNNVLMSGGGNCTSSNATNVAVSPNLAATNTNRSWGYFKKENSDFPFDSGIVLSTGYAKNAGNSYLAGVLSDPLPSLGDADLATALNITSTSLTNATYIEFDFVPISDKISFNYLLASEEYNGFYECDYTDAFALLLKKVGDPSYTNLAILPNGGGVVSTSNIHPAVNSSGGSCAAINQQFFAGYNTTNSDTNFQGRTIPLTATATVIPGATYHFKMVVADYFDHKYDTAVFLDAGSFDIGVKITDGQGTFLPDTVKMCNNSQVLAANVQAANATFKWFLNNVLIAGATTNSYTATQPGTYKVEVAVLGSTCTSIATVSLVNGTSPSVDLTDAAGISLPDTVLFCNSVNQMLKAATTVPNAVFEWYQNSVLISGAVADSYTATQSGTYTVKVTAPNYDCSTKESIDLNIVGNPIVQNAVLTGCSPTATALFDLTSAEPQISNTPGITFTYYAMLADAQAENANSIVTPTAYSSSAATVYVLIKLGQCSEIAQLQLNTILGASVTSQPTDQVICLGNNAVFSIVAQNAVGYQWQVDTGSGFTDVADGAVYNGSTTNTLTISAVGKTFNGYKYKVLVKGNCLPGAASAVVSLLVPEIKVAMVYKDVTCYGLANGIATVTVSEGKAPYTYLWSNGGTGATVSQLAPGMYSVVVTDATNCSVTEKVTIKEPTALSTVITKTAVSCNGKNDGSIKVVASGGTTPYSFYWPHNSSTSANVSGLKAGTYIVDVQDANGCIKTEQIVVAEPLVLTAVVNGKDVSCHAGTNGEAAVIPAGGTAPYTYLWSNGTTTATASQLVLGIYSVMVTDANGCTVNKTINIAEPTALDAVFAQTKAGCNGAIDDAVMVHVTGGVAPYTYLWSNGVTADKVLSPLGDYSVVVTDAKGCMITKTINIAAITDLTVNFNQTNVSCNGAGDGAATAIVSGGKAPFSYHWSTGVTSDGIKQLKPGVYTVTVKDGLGCIVTEDVTITEPNVLAVTSSQTNVNCYKGTDGTATLHVTGGNAPYQFQWSNGLTTERADQLTAGSYSITIKDAKGCTANINVVITEPTDIPAPVTYNQTFCKVMNATVADLVATGSQVAWYKNGTGGQPLDASDILISGIYYATQKINGCETVTKAAVMITIQDTPAPNGQSSQAFCSPLVPTIAHLQLNGSNIKWYSTATGGNEISKTTVLSNGGLYYASQTLNGCESLTRFSVKVFVYSNIPISTNYLTVCDAVNIQDVTIDGFSGNQLKWYNSLTATQELSKNGALTSGTYYISTFTNNLCESDRKAIQIVVGSKVPAPTVSAQNFCGQAVVNDLVAGSVVGAKVNWYSSSQSVTPLTGTTPLVNGTYYVDQEIGPCKSGRVAVAVRVIATTAPTMNNFKLCESATVADLYLSGSTSLKYVWFVDATTINTLPDDYTLTNGFYYVAIDTGGCISSRTKVQVTIYNRPYAPTGNMVQRFTFQATVSDIKMNEPNVAWFASQDDAMNRVNQISSGTPLIDGKIYYGVLIDGNGCPSYPTAVQVNVTLGIEKLDEAYLTYYPNPVDSALTISYKETILKIEIYSILGQQIYTRSFDSNEVKIDFSSFSSGTYMVRVATPTASQFIKVVKK